MKLWRKHSKTPEKSIEELEFERFLDHDCHLVNALHRAGLFTVTDVKSYLQEHGSFLGIQGIGKTFDELIREIVRRNENDI